MGDVTIQAIKNGPLVVKGAIQLTDGQGQAIPTTEPAIALCRCGHSGTKPMCDGSHKRVGFQG